MDCDALKTDLCQGCRVVSVPTRGVSTYLAVAVRCLVIGGYVVSGCLVSGCASIPQNTVDEILKPSNDRNWKASQAVLPSARVRGDRVRIDNVRNCVYLDEDSYVLNYEDRTYNLNDMETLDFIVCPFAGATGLAHTMMSFGCRDGRYLGVSIEVRLEEGETFSALGGAIRQFEIMYVLADERDLIQLRTERQEIGCVHLPLSNDARRGARDVCRCPETGQHAQEAPRVLRHVRQQLHDQHHRPRQSRTPGSHSVGAGFATHRLRRS